MDEFSREWTYRTPMVTVTYPAGHRVKLPAPVRAAALADGALVEVAEDPAPTPKRRRSARVDG